MIIGGGAAGYTAALYCARSNLSSLVIEKAIAGGQMTAADKIDNYPGFQDGTDGYTLSINMKNSAEKFGAITKYAEVTDIDIHNEIKKIIADNIIFTSKALIIATGSKPRVLGLNGEKEMSGKGISYCALCDGMFYKDKITCVIGGGNTAVTEAIMLSKICKKVYLIHRRDTFTASKIYLNILFSTENIETITNSEVQNYIFDQKINGISIRNKITENNIDILCDGIFIAIGSLPNSAIFKNKLSLNNEGYIEADETTKTNIAGVFAAGDIRSKSVKQIITAAADGAVASVYAEEYINLLNKK